MILGILKLGFGERGEGGVAMSVSSGGILEYSGREERE